MLKLRKILVPVDFSEASSKAVRYGASIATETGARLLLAHIVEFSVPVGYVFPAETDEIVKKRVEEARFRLSGFLPAEYRENVDSRIIVKAGDIEEELLAVCDDESIDLVVMGTHGHRPFQRWLLGSTTERMLRRSPVPLLTVPRLENDLEIPGPRRMRPEKILFATDLSDPSTEALGAAHRLAGDISAELVVLHVMRGLRWAYGPESMPLDMETDSGKLREGLEKRLVPQLAEAGATNARHTVVEGIPWETILHFGAAEKADLIVISTQSKSGLERALLGATAERVVRGSEMPVLSVPASREIASSGALAK